jgi:hypothetical protein
MGSCAGDSVALSVQEPHCYCEFADTGVFPVPAALAGPLSSASASSDPLGGVEHSLASLRLDEGCVWCWLDPFSCMGGACEQAEALEEYSWQDALLILPVVATALVRPCALSSVLLMLMCLVPCCWSH